MKLSGMMVILSLAAPLAAAQNNNPDAGTKNPGYSNYTNRTITVSDPNGTPHDESQDYAESSADRAINQKIREKLSGGWLTKGYDTIGLKTAQGNVTITGTVEKTSDVQKITDEVRKVDGVKNITNNVTVKSK